MKGNSTCCDAKIINGLCFDCKEHAEPFKFDCEICEDTGEVSCDERDSDGNWEHGTGTQICECRLDSEVDFSGSSEGDR